MTRSAPKSHRSAPKKVQVCTSPAARAVAFLRGRHPTKTAEHVEAATGIGAATVKNWLMGVAAPGGDAMARLVLAYGLDLIGAMCDRAPDWLSAAAREVEEAQLRADHARIAARLALLGQRP